MFLSNEVTGHTEYMLGTELAREGGEMAMSQRLDLSQPPSAVLCANNLMVVCTLNPCQKRNCPVPEKMSIIGFEDIPLARFTRPPLATVAQPAYDMADFLLNRTQNSALLPQQATLQSTPNIRESTAAPVG